MKRKLMAIAVAIISWCVFADTWIDPETGIEWTYTVSDGKASVDRANPATGAIAIPSKLGGSPVTSINDYAFYDCSALTDVTIPEGVTSIGDWAFASCSLTSVAIPEGVTSIGERAFNNCIWLTHVTMSEGVTSIGSSAFSCCSTLTSVTIPNSVTNIGDWAFSSCSALGDGIIIVDNCVLTINGTCPTSAVLPEGTRLIAECAFFGRNSLTSIAMPSSVTSIGEAAFAYCSGLATVMFDGDAPSCGDSVFYDVASCCTATVYAGTSGWDEDGDGMWQGLTLEWVQSVGDATQLDSDVDGLKDYEEEFYGTDPTNPDTDGDGMNDYEEVVIYGTNPTKKDTDGDGMDDYWEVVNGTDPTNDDAEQAIDGDVMAYAVEGVDLVTYDADGDGTVETYAKRYAVVPKGETNRLYRTFSVNGKTYIGAPTAWRPEIGEMGTKTATVVLMHSAVYDWYGYDTTTARITHDGTNAVMGANTKAFTYGDKYRTDTYYLPQFGIEYHPVNPNATDSNNNQIDDGWELYVALAQVAKIKSFPVSNEEQIRHAWVSNYDPNDELGPKRGRWYNDFIAAKAYAETNLVPMLVIWGNDNCAYCDKLEAACAEEDFKEWANERQYVMVIAWGKGTASGLAAYNWIKSVANIKEYPFVGVYWTNDCSVCESNVVQEAFVGRNGKMPVTEGTLQEQLMASVDMLLGSNQPEPQSWQMEITFVVPNGEASEHVHAYTNGAYGSLPEARRDGFTFAGWYTALDGTNRVSAFSEVDPNVNTLYARWVEDDASLYAQWQANAYSVSFNANGGEGEMAAQPFLYDQAQALNGNGFTRLGYTFKGWATAPDGEVVYTNGVSVSNLTAEAGFAVALFSKWEKAIEVETEVIEDWVAYDLAPVFKKDSETKTQYRRRFEEKFGDDYEAAFFKPTGKIGMDGTKLCVWHDYVAGTDPLDETSQFKATVTMESGVPVVKWEPALNGEGVKSGERLYKVLGAKTLGGGWAEVEDGHEADYNFFKVTVEMK